MGMSPAAFIRANVDEVAHTQALVLYLHLLAEESGQVEIAGAYGLLADSIDEMLLDCTQMKHEDLKAKVLAAHDVITGRIV